MIDYETRRKIQRLRQTPGVQNRLQQYFRYQKKHQHIVLLGKIMIAYIFLIAIMALFKVLFTLGNLTKLLILITAFITAMFPLFFLPIYLITKHSKKKYYQQIKEIATKHNLGKYIKILIKPKQGVIEK